FLRGGLGPGSYYFPIMIQFIFYFPVIFFIIRKYDLKGLFFCGFVNFAYEILKTAYDMGEVCYRLLLFRYTLIIAYGCYLAMGNYKRNKKLSLLCIVSGIVYIIVFCYLGAMPPITNMRTGTCFWACLFIIPLASPLIINKLHNRFIELLGKASYDIFLVQMVYYYGVGRVYVFVNGIYKNRMLLLFINIVICISAGLIFCLIEKPVTKMLSAKAGRLVERYRKSRQRRAV
ncbi:MAG: hypothetical protein J5777_03525, partial [Clostridiales bacterium]|nr:hypothetical protein [Clostridiales bacterium]